MCGIAGVYIKDPNSIKSHEAFEKFVDHLLLGIEHRGKHATGFVAVTREGKVTLDKADETASDFIKTRERIPKNPWYVLLHTRFATKGNPKHHANNHPVIYGTCFTTHNGTIENDDALFDHFGLKRNAEVDTEILPAIVGMTNFKIDKIRELFEDVDGACAMATIDPINHLGKVLLLRTEKSPLYILDGPKYTIWASTLTSIKEAWGKVLGTPPHGKRFKYVPEWKFMILEGQDDPGTYDLIPKPKPEPKPVMYSSFLGLVKDDITGHWVSPSELERGKAERTQQQETGTVVTGTVVTLEQIRARVREKRLLGQGRAKTWGNVLIPKVGRKWHHCSICRLLVEEGSFRDTINHGRICVDCADAYIELYRKAAEEQEQKAQDTLEGLAKEFDLDNEIVPLVQKTFSKESIDRLCSWATEEDQIHAQVMQFLADGTGINSAALEYLMFRANIGEIEAINSKVAALIDKLWDEYDLEYQSLWEEVDPKGPVAVKDIIQEDKPKKMPAYNHFVNNGASKRLNLCLFCNKKPAMRLVMADRKAFDFNYCHRHHSRCSIKGCLAKANHTRRDGLRVCHRHARGMKECYADTWLEQNGYSLEAA
jgi:hypothetical protein